MGVARAARHNRLVTTLIGGQANTLGVHSELATGTYDLLHYCGHVVMAEGTQYAGLYLHGKDLFDQRSMADLDAQRRPARGVRERARIGPCSGSAELKAATRPDASPITIIQRRIRCRCR